MSKEMEAVIVDQGRIDEIIWRYADLKSARQIADLAGVTPDVVLRRKRELYDEVDPLSIQQARQRLIIDLQSIARRTQDDYDKADMEFKSGIMNSSVAAMKVVLAELARMEKADNSKVEQLNQLRIRELVGIVQETVDTSVVEISEKYGLDQDELFDLFNRRLVESAQKREAQ